MGRWAQPFGICICMICNFDLLIAPLAIDRDRLVRKRSINGRCDFVTLDLGARAALTNTRASILLNEYREKRILRNDVSGC